MKHRTFRTVCVTSLIAFATLNVTATAAVPVTAAPDQAALLKSTNPKLAANKRLVYDFWRTILEAGHNEMAEKYMAESYIQHNPNADTGRSGFLKYFAGRAPKEIQPTIQKPLVAIVAEGDLVVLSFVDSQPLDGSDRSQTYTTTWFDMFRVENGKIVEHWDVAKMQLKKP